MREGKTGKVTISLPRELVDYADQLAKEREQTRSGVMADLLEKEKRAQIAAFMEEGYRETAEEDLRFAEEAFPLAGEMIRRGTRWDEDADG